VPKDSTSQRPYPYNRRCDFARCHCAPGFKAGGRDAFVTRLQDPKQRAAIRQAVERKRQLRKLGARTGGPEGILITGVRQNELKKYEGKTVADLGKMMNKDRSRQPSI